MFWEIVSSGIAVVLVILAALNVLVFLFGVSSGEELIDELKEHWEGPGLSLFEVVFCVALMPTMLAFLGKWKLLSCTGGGENFWGRPRFKRRVK